MTAKQPENGAEFAPETILTHGGRDPQRQYGYVNTPVYRGSTIVFPTLAAMDDYKAPYRYGRNDNPTSEGLANLISELEGAAGTVLAPSGLGAISTALLAMLSAGDDVLITDSAYEPTRTFGSEGLARFGITARYYDPRIGAGIEALFQPNTKAVLVESPGSLTFEVQDLPAIVAVAHARGAVVIVDNSWATPLFHRPLALGADVVLHAGTKMFVGHSDVMIGTVSANEANWPRLKRTHRILGITVSPDDAYLTARGLRTLGVRMAAHNERALAVARWLREHPLVEEVAHPALPDHPDHAIWQRDFTGSGSLFGFRLKAAPRSTIAAMMDGLQLFGMGYSWGGYESLLIPNNPATIRTAKPLHYTGNNFRMHVGLENTDDLIADLSAGLDRYAAAIG